MKETKAYKTYLSFASGATPPKKARKFKKPASLQLTTVSVSPEEPSKKSKRVKRPAKKSTKAPTGGVVIRESPDMSLSKKKEKMTIEKRKGIDLLSEVELTEEAQYEEVHKKRTSVKPGVPDVTKEESTKIEAESWGKDEDDSNNEHDSRSEGNSKRETDENESGSESDQEENEEEIGDDEEEEEDEFVRTLSNDTDNEDETKIKDKAEGDEDEEMDYTTSQLYDNVDIRLNKPVTTNERFNQKEVITESSPIYSTVIPQSIPSFTPSPPQSTLTSPPTTKATNPPSALLDFASVFQFNNRVSALEKDVSELKKDDPLKTQVTALVDEHLDARLGATKDEFMNYLSASITTRITEQVKNQLSQILPKEVSNFAPPVIQSMVTESLEHAVLAKESSQPKSTYEAASSLTEFELKKIFIDKMDESQSYLTAPEHRECYDGLIKSNSVQSEEPEFEVADSDMPQDQEENLEPTDPDWNDGKTPQQGPTQSWLMTLASSADKPSKTFDELMSTHIDFSAYIINSMKISNLTQETLLGPAFKLLKCTRSNYAELEYDFKECYKALSEKLDWDNQEGDDYPFDLTKPYL
ncbi:hypothetical protein Tco_0771731 [Tanacetum coccineum]|uniref:Uncharacterized protein n=1 Tax=Tanacetum coccineum TaxID=301880 RepID=A0ABQ4ZJA1_9ASTR